MPGMKSPEDWDYAAVQKRYLELHKPPFVKADGKIGNHCPHCPKAADEHCILTCSTEYKTRYGFDPPT